jgi:hypothetical protein
LRVFVFGDCVFAAKIPSPDVEGAQVDCRRRQADPSLWHATTLDPDLTVRLQAYLKAASLGFGVFDLIVTPDEQIMFHEGNVDSPWLSMEHFLEYSVASQFSNWLLVVIDGSIAPRC